MPFCDDIWDLELKKKKKKIEIQKVANDLKLL